MKIVRCSLLLSLMLPACQSPDAATSSSQGGHFTLDNPSASRRSETVAALPAAPLAKLTTASSTIGLEDGCGHAVLVTDNPFSLSLITTEGEVKSVVAPGGLRIGSVPDLDSDYHYDPYYFYQNLFPRAQSGPTGLRWLSVSRMDYWTYLDTTLRMSLRLEDGSSAWLDLEPSCPTAFALHLWAPDTPTAYVGLDLEVGDGERFYGLGEYYDSVEHRGTLRAMQFELDLQNHEDFYNEAHVPVPLLLSTGSWGVFVDDYHPGIFDVAKTVSSEVRIEYGTRDLTFYWLAADRPASLIETYSRLTGLPAKPPVWAFAPIFWRDEVTGQEMVLEDADAIRSNGLTGSGIWLDRPYETFISSMDFEPSRYPDPEAMVEALHDDGFRLAGWNVPYLQPEDPAFPLFDESGWLVEGLNENNDWGPMVDLTHPEAMEFWQARVGDAIDRGFEGWKMDYGEDVITGVGNKALHYTFDNGEDADTMHHRYSDFYHRAYFEPYQPEDVFVISRTGVQGGQRYTSVIWPGDLATDYSYYHEEGSVGGLPAAMIAGLSLSASGYPFYACDTGGYRTPRPDSEQLIRWVQYSAFLPVMQYGGCGDHQISCNPWDFSDQGDRTYTPETLELFTTYSRLHTRLFPFFYRLAELSSATGKPPALPFGLMWPELERHPDDEMVIGNVLLVAPLVRGGTSRRVVLPPVPVIDLRSGERLSGVAELNASAPLEEVPLYLVEGAIVPMLRPSVESLAPVSDPSIDSFASSAGRIWGDVVPGPQESTFDLPFEGGTFSTKNAGGITLTFSPSASGTRFSGVNLRIYAPTAATVLLEGSSGSLPQVSPGGTESCTACFARESGSPWLWVGLDQLRGWTLKIQ